jgi:DNA-binding response OmpR family regulator
MSDVVPSPPSAVSPRTHSVVVYSDDAAVRDQVRQAIGRRPAGDLGRVEWVECSTGKQVVAAVDAGGVDACVLDGEAWPTGGIGLAKQMKDELADCPPVCVLIARRDDRWLATWSQADAVVAHPIDAPELTTVVAELLRRREAGLPVRRAVH